MTQTAPSMTPSIPIPPPWAGSFLVDGETNGTIQLRQVGVKDFVLESTIRYIGARTGLEGKVSEACIADIREVTPEDLRPHTDLTSVPPPLRWFVSQYGSHTPAALIHDRLIGLTPPIPGLTDAYSDRYFRMMLKDVKVRWLRRWLMWAAVAARTRSKTGVRKLIGLILWFVASIAGMATAVVGIATQSWLLILVSAVAPFVLAGLWGRQYGAGLVAALAAPWLVPPTVLGVTSFCVYSVLERVVGLFVERTEPRPEPISYESF
jgi:hypothetical protein